ncbi:centrosomal protein of 135 kDa-like [Neltuma alba]|uniref:centrosomal protein of 135 kDa-like n=1 Tax=Neltuma alba TaxID=207710 RepID=UPI0010A4BA3F|nr:centrosomal protein of 135 kDa-like [Prosopis alba]
MALLQKDIEISGREDEIKVTQEETRMPYVSNEHEDDDLMRLFQVMEEGSVHEVNSEVTKALVDLEASLKADLNDIATSEKDRLCLENALTSLSSLCSNDDLKATIHSLQQEIQTILSSFKQASATIDTATKLEQKENVMIGQRSQRKEAAMTLLSEIHRTQNSMVEAQTREVELKEQISKLQAELYSKEKEIKECQTKLLSLQEQKKKSVSDTVGFLKELEAVKKERSHMVKDQIKAKQQLENVNCKWSSCVDNLKKTSMLLGSHLKHKL